MIHILHLPYIPLYTTLGYGTTEGGIDYYHFKNGWSDTWGNKGYMKMQRGTGGRAGLCGILLGMTYPNLEPLVTSTRRYRSPPYEKNL